MHPALHLSALFELPFSVRRFATQEASGSEPDMLKVIEHMNGSAHAPSHRFLPVIWPLLDPARIPPEAALESRTPSRAAVAALAMAYHALAALHLVDPACVPSGIYAAFWPWMELLQIYRTLLPHTVAADPLRHRFLALISPMLVDLTTRPLIHATPGFYTFAGLVWSRISLKHYSPADEGALEGLHHFLVGSTWQLSHMEELLDGAGGIPVLAKLVVQQISALRTYFKLNYANGPYIRFLVQFLCVVGAWSARWPDLQSALRHVRLVRALTATLITLAEVDLIQPGVDLGDAGKALNYSLILLQDLVCQCEHGHGRFPLLVEAMEADLLRALVSVGSLGLPGIDNTPHLQYFLRDLLPAAMVHHPIICATRGKCPGPPTAGPAHARFMRSSVLPSWLALRALITARTSTLEVFESPRYISLKFCDHYTECKNVKLASEIKCCSGCRGAHYCSSECQRAAWNDGHREGCQALYDRVTSFRGLFGSRRDEAFVRHIMLQDYKTSKATVLRAQVLFLRANPTVQRFCTVFDYMQGECAIRVAALEDLGPQSCVEDVLRAAERFGSVTSLHQVVITADGGAEARLTYVLRSSNLILEEGVLRIAAQDELEGSALARELKILSKTSVVEAYA